MELVPHDPAALLALVENPTEFERLAGLPAAAGLADFMTGGDVSEAWLEHLRGGVGPDPYVFGFAVVEGAPRAVIGTVGFKGPPDAEGVVEIAYGIVPGHQRRGMATRAAALATEFAFADDRVRIVRAHTLPERNASTRVLEKCGYRFVAPVDDPDDGPVWRFEKPRAAE